MVYLLIIPAIIIFVIVLILSIRNDYSEWLKEKRQKHGRDWRNRALMLTPALILLSWPARTEWQIYLYSFLIIAFAFGLLFDGLLNLKKRKRIYELDPNGTLYKQFDFWFSGAGDDPAHKKSIWDALQKMLGRTGSIIFKIGGIVISLSLYLSKLL